MLLPLMASPRYSVFQTLQLGPPELRGLINSVLLIFFFYANYLYFIPQLYQKKKQFSWILIALVSLLAVSFLPFQLVDKIDIKPMDNHREMNPTHRIEKPAFSDGFHSPHDNGPRKPRHDKGKSYKSKHWSWRCIFWLLCRIDHHSFFFRYYWKNKFEELGW